MPWPVTSRFQNFVSATTRIMVAFLHAVQDAIIGLYAGTRTVKSIGVDGVGDQVNSAGAGNIQATGNMVAGGHVTADAYLKSFLAKSSATPGAGQAVAAGEVWKDSTIFAYCRLKQTGGNTVSVLRSMNLASAPTEAVTGKYVFALQTAAPNGLLVFAQVVGVGVFAWSVNPATLTTSGFEVWLFAMDTPFAFAELANNDELHVVVTAY